jgi:hypothetical protein
MRFDARFAWQRRAIHDDGPMECRGEEFGIGLQSDHGWRRRVETVAPELSRYRAANELSRNAVRLRNGAGHGFPLRHRADAMKVSVESGSSVMRGDEEITERWEYRDEPLQPAW